EEEDHHDPVHRKHFVIGVRTDEITCWSDQLEPDQNREKAPDNEEEGDRSQIEKRNSLVIQSQEPGLETIPTSKVILGFDCSRSNGCRTHCSVFVLSSVRTSGFESPDKDLIYA